MNLLTIVVLLVAFFSGRLLAADAAATGPFRAGAAAVDVTPSTLPVRVNGGFLEKVVSQVHDRLFARAIVFDNGTTRLALCVVD